MSRSPLHPGAPRCCGPLLAVLTLAAFGGAEGQAPASAVPLGPPNAVLQEPFSQIRGVRELRDGRLLITDWIEERLLLVDPALTRATPLGRTGAGPTEYRLPATLLPMAGDSTLLADVGNGRFLVIAPSGQVVRSIPADRPGLGSASGIDDRGRLYYGMPVWARQASPLPDDSIEVLRFDPATQRSERLAVVKGSTPPAHRGPRLTPGFSMVAMAPQDAWRVLPDGELLVLRAGSYRLERIGPTGTVRGPSHLYPLAPVRPADRSAFVRDFVARSPTSGRGPDGGMGHSPPMTDAEIARMVETNEFAATLPPFERVILGPDGELWVQRGRHAGDPAIYDRLSPAGERVGQVRLGPGRTLVALGQRHAYVAAADSDGLETLERYPRPR